MTETQAARRAEPTVQHIASGNAAGWAALLAGLGSLLLATNNPVVVAAAALGVAVTGQLVGGPRRHVHREFLSIATLVALFRICLALVLSGEQGGLVLLDRPSWQPAPGVSFGGPLTTDALIVGLTAGARVFAFIGLIGVGYQAVAASRWTALARSFLGRGATIVAPWCHLGESLEAAWLRAGIQRGQGSRSTPAERWAGAIRGAALVDRDEGPAPFAVLRGATLTCLLTLPVVMLTDALPGWLTSGLSAFDLAVLACLPLLVAAQAKAPGQWSTALIGFALLAVVSARAWVPGTGLTWSPADGWGEVPYVWVVATLVLPVAAVLEPRGMADA